MSKKMAVVLCGSGYKDGSEIRESVLTLLALSQQGIAYQCFAPDLPQFDVVNCYTGKVSEHDARNMLVEAARIARGDIHPLSSLECKSFDGIILPGGFGAAKNLCQFAQKGIDGEVLSELKKILEDFHVNKKPIGAICISPAILALAFKGMKFKLTLGSRSRSSELIVQLGHEHVECETDQCVVDEDHLIVTTPAYMDDSAELSDIFEGIKNLVSQLKILS